jgi:hypothetical protein
VIVAAEDQLLQACVRRVFRELDIDDRGASWIPPRGQSHLAGKSASFVRAASGGVPILVVTDLDMKPCPATIRTEWFGQDLPRCLLLTVAVREVDSWILGDCDGLGEFLNANARLDAAPETLQDPKQTLVNIASKSRTRAIREEFRVSEGAVARVGPGYNAMLQVFVEKRWRIDAAAAACPSFRRFLNRVPEWARPRGPNGAEK